jgi:TusA-related sulfurtransferase
VDDMPAPGGQLHLASDAVLEMLHVDAMSGASCALLIPALKSKMRELQAGQVLEVQVDDPTAQEDIASWCWLTGHVLLLITEVAPHQLQLFIQKRSNTSN